MSNPTGINTRPLYEPSPEQIAAECERIRAGWSEERWNRELRRIHMQSRIDPGAVKCHVRIPRTLEDG